MVYIISCVFSFFFFETFTFDKCLRAHLLPVLCLSLVRVSQELHLHVCQDLSYRLLSPGLLSFVFSSSVFFFSLSLCSHNVMIALTSPMCPYANIIPSMRCCETCAVRVVLYVCFGLKNRLPTASPEGHWCTVSIHRDPRCHDEQCDIMTERHLAAVLLCCYTN